MSKNGLSRRQFVGGAAVIAAASAMPVITTASPAFAAVATMAGADMLPSFSTNFPTGLNATELARKGLEIYRGKHHGSGCGEGTYWPIVEALAVAYPETWGTMPKNTFVFGSGGINGSGATCGNVNGGAALLKQAGAPATMINEFLAWFERTPLPSNAAYVDYRTGTWTPGGSATGGWGSGGTQLLAPLNNAPKVKPESTSCHVALTRWNDAARSWTTVKGSGAKTDRCSKATYDSVYKLATMINDWKLNGVTFSGAADPVVATCTTSACHGTAGQPPANGTMKCTPCHTQRVGDGHNL